VLLPKQLLPQLKELNYSSKLNILILNLLRILTRAWVTASLEFLEKKALFPFGEEIGLMLLDISQLKLSIFQSRMLSIDHLFMESTQKRNP
jgi:hypothetical protein